MIPLDTVSETLHGFHRSPTSRDTNTYMISFYDHCDIADYKVKMWRGNWHRRRVQRQHWAAEKWHGEEAIWPAMQVLSTWHKLPESLGAAEGGIQSNCTFTDQELLVKAYCLQEAHLGRWARWWEIEGEMLEWLIWSQCRWSGWRVSPRLMPFVEKHLEAIPSLPALASGFWGIFSLFCFH